MCAGQRSGICRERHDRTARALAAALTDEGPFDLILTGRNSIDADTGQVPPQIAQLLDLPFACGVKELALDGDRFAPGM